MTRRFYSAFVITDVGQAPEDGYGVVFPDFPGCVTDGDTVLQALENAIEVLALHVLGMSEADLRLPQPTSIDRPDWLASDDVVIVQSVLVPVDLPDQVVRANITMDEALLKRIDLAAAHEGFTRSGYLAQAARERLQRPHVDH